MIKPLISVILPVYNGEKYLKEAIESILNQTYTNFELIIVNDGSIDNSKSIISSFSDKRINVIEQNNKGLAFALNIAASHCRGEYIARMDQDDISDSNRFLIQCTFLQAHPKISVLSGAVGYINETGNYLGRSFPVTCPFLIRKKLLSKGNVICHPSVIMRKKDFDNVGGYSENIGGWIADYHLWVKFAKQGYKIQNLSKILLQYRIIENSMSSEFSLSRSSKKILPKAIKEENPNLNELADIYNTSKRNKDGVSKRRQVYNNKQNLVYSKLTWIGENTRNNLFSGIINLAALFSLNF